MQLLGSADITLDPIDDDNQTYPTVLLTFGYTVIKGGFAETGVQAIGADVILQAFDISTGTPVLTDTKRYPMRPLDGDYPTQWIMRGVKLDTTRGILAWQGDVEWLLLFKVVDGIITMGQPYMVADDWVTPQNTTYSPEHRVLNDASREMALVPLKDGQAAWIALFRDYHQPGSFSTWYERLVGARISTADVTITNVAYWVLEPGFVRYQFMNDGTSGARSVGNVTYYAYQLREAWTTNLSYYWLGRIDWDAPEPQLVRKEVSELRFHGMEVTKDHVVLMANIPVDGGATRGGYLLQPIADFAADFTVVQPESGVVAGPNGGAYYVFLDHALTSGGGWLARSLDNGTQYVHEMRVVDGQVKEVDTSEFTRTVPAGYNDWGEYAVAMPAADRIVAIAEYEKDEAPWSMHETMYVFGRIHRLAVEVRDTRLAYGFRGA